jgi:integrase/recombinase XerD
MHSVRIPRTLPVILSPEEVTRLIASAENLKHQVALSVAYCGPQIFATRQLKLTSHFRSADVRRQRILMM